MAKQLYTQRVSELKRDLEETNAKYSTLTHEIEEIRAGKWDDRLLANAGRQDTTSAPSSTTSPTRDNDTTMQEADATPTTTTVKAEPMDTTHDTTTTPSISEPNAPKEQEIKKEPSESSPIVTASESSSTLQPSSADPISEVPQNISTFEKVVAGTDANAEVPTSMPSPSALPIAQQQPSSSLSSTTSPPPPKTTTTTISGADDNQLPPSPKPLSPSKPPPAEQPVDNTTAAMDTQPLIESTTSQNEIQRPDGDTRQETANVPSMVLAPTPKEALSAEPHMTTHPTLPVQMEPRPPSGQPGSEDSFHSAEELDTTQQQQPATATAASVQELSSSSSPPQTSEKPSSNVPIEQQDNTTTQPSPTEENEVDMNMKRKADEEISDNVEHKRPRMDNVNGSVTQQQQPDSSETAISDLVSQPTPGESPEEERQSRRRPQQHDSPTPSSAAQTPASNAKSPEAHHSSTMADTESVTGSESNAPTPTASTGSTRKHKDEQRQQKSWQKNINLLWREIANHKNGAVFMNPIKEATAPLYYQIIKHPMDLKAIKNRIREGVSIFSHFYTE